MKRILCNVFFVALAISLMAFSCQKDEIPVGNLPTKAQSFINQYSSNTRIIQAETESNGGYSVDLVNGVEVDFDSNGNWVKVDAPDTKTIPTDFIPATIVGYTKENYPNNLINSIEKKVSGYEVELVGIPQDLIFDLEGKFVRLN